MAADSFRILQISDPHLYAEADGRMHGVCTADSLARVLRHALADSTRQPDLLLVTGDLVQDESKPGYERLRDQLQATKLPIAVIPGNHDAPPLLTGILGAAGFQVGGCIDRGPWRLILLSTWLAHAAGGELAASELQFLEDSLRQRGNAHTLVVLHHHPVPMGSRWLDTVALRNPADLLAVIDRHPQVRGLAWGHVHQASDRQRGALRLLSTPSTCYQFLPGSSEFALDTRPPGYRWLELESDGSITTQVIWLESAS